MLLPTARTAGAVHTLPGWPFVIVQILPVGPAPTAFSTLAGMASREARWAAIFARAVI
jgi:hypothetical protein